MVDLNQFSKNEQESLCCKIIKKLGHSVIVLESMNNGLNAEDYIIVDASQPNDRIFTNIIGKNLYELSEYFSLEKLLPAIKKACSSNDIITLNKVKVKNRWFNIRLFNIEKKSIILEYEDITSTLNTYSNLLEENNVFEAIFQRSQHGYIVTKCNDGLILDVNDSFLQLTNYERKDVLGKSARDLLWVEPKLREQLVKMLDQKDTVISMEIKMYRKDKSSFDGQLYCVIADVKGVPCIISEVIDITEEKIEKTKREQAMKLLEGIVDGINGSLALKDNKGRYILVNDNFKDTIGFSRKQLIGKTDYDLIEYERAYNYHQEDQKVISSLHGISYEDVITNSDGSKCYYFVQKSPVMLPHNQELGLCMLSFDITEKKEIQKALAQSEANYQLLFNSMINGFAVFNIIYDKDNNPHNGEFLQVNNAFEHITGMKAIDILGKTVRDVLPQTAQFWVDSCNKAVLHNSRVGFDTYLSSIEKYLHIHAFSPKDGQIALVFNDITERKRFENELYAEKEQLRITFKSIGDGVITTDASGKVEMLNDVAEMLTGWKSEEARGIPLAQVFDIYNEYTGEKVDSPVDKVLETGNIVLLANHTVLKSKNGSIRSIADSAAPIKDRSGSITGVVLVFRDVTEEMQQREKVAYLSFHDILTGVYNRTYLEEEGIKRFTNEQYPISLIMGDVNCLKTTNDIFGHKKGDLLLQTIVKILKQNCRPEDLLVRWAGDEFVILLPNTTSQEVKQICKNIYDSCEEYDHKAMGLPIMPSIALGYATQSESSQSALHLIPKAEDLMYHRKLQESRMIHKKIIASMKNTVINSFDNAEKYQCIIKQSQALAKLLKLSHEDIKNLKQLAMLHDIGKIALDDKLKNDNRSLVSDGHAQIKRHPEIGFRIAKSSTELASIAEYILTHHERWDGKGYPNGLSGEDIPLLSRIFSVVDQYYMIKSQDNIKSEEEAIAELWRYAGSKLDPHIVELFLQVI